MISLDLYPSTLKWISSAKVTNWQQDNCLTLEVLSSFARVGTLLRSLQEDHFTLFLQFLLGTSKTGQCNYHYELILSLLALTETYAHCGILVYWSCAVLCGLLDPQSHHSEVSWCYITTSLHLRTQGERVMMRRWHAQSNTISCDTNGIIHTIKPVYCMYPVWCKF